MLRLALHVTRLLFLLAIFASLAGCIMCCEPHYDMFPAYGGAWERTDRNHGVVGSMLHPEAGQLVEAGSGGLTTRSNVEEVEPPADREPEPDDEPDEFLPPLPDDFQPAPAAPLEPPAYPDPRSGAGDPLQTGLR
ncbi:MAG: hypothetical protein KDB14_25915 [Planctomycetales bacterium]|nr:hypothetical protein [Planctomycetales bacterium]